MLISRLIFLELYLTDCSTSLGTLLFQHNMDTIKEEPGPRAETRSRSSSHGDQADVKPEHLPEPFSFVEVKQELVCIVCSVKKHLLLSTGCL